MTAGARTLAGEALWLDGHDLVVGEAGRERERIDLAGTAAARLEWRRGGDLRLVGRLVLPWAPVLAAACVLALPVLAVRVAGTLALLGALLLAAAHLGRSWVLVLQRDGVQRAIALAPGRMQPDFMPRLHALLSTSRPIRDAGDLERAEARALRLAAAPERL